MIKIKFKNIDDLNKCIIKNLTKIPYDIDLIVGVPRDGLMPAVLISKYLNKPFMTLNDFLNEEYNMCDIIVHSTVLHNKLNVKPKKILIVDDCFSTGGTFKNIKNKLNNKSNIDVIFCAIYLTHSENKKKVDIYFEQCPHPKFFEWDLFDNAPKLKHSCVDIDGVLCQNCKPEQDDDGIKYIDFLTNAIPFIIPDYLIGYLVTARLEKYRKETETWLKKYNVKYNKLIMLDLPSKEERRKINIANYKAKVYKNTKAKLFIESNDKLSKEIAQKTKKPVFCVENHKYYLR